MAAAAAAESLRVPDGLGWKNDVLPKEEYEKLLALIRSIPEEQWVPVGASQSSRDNGGRKVLQFGALYDYRTRKVSTEGVAPFPDWLQALCKQIAPSMGADQCIINRYRPGQGISAHTDSAEFGDSICCFSLEAPGTMLFRPRDAARTEPAFEFAAVANGLYTMQGSARRDYTHEMLPIPQPTSVSQLTQLPISNQTARKKTGAKKNVPRLFLRRCLSPTYFLSHIAALVLSQLTLRSLISPSLSPSTSTPTQDVDANLCENVDSEYPNRPRIPLARVIMHTHTRVSCLLLPLL